MFCSVERATIVKKINTKQKKYLNCYMTTTGNKEKKNRKTATDVSLLFTTNKEKVTLCADTKYKIILCISGLCGPLPHAASQPASPVYCQLILILVFNFSLGVTRNYGNLLTNNKNEFIFAAAATEPKRKTNKQRLSKKKKINKKQQQILSGSFFQMRVLFHSPARIEVNQRLPVVLCWHIADDVFFFFWFLIMFQKTAQSLNQKKRFPLGSIDLYCA